MYKLGIPDCIKTIVFAGLTSVISRMMNDFNSVIYAAYQVGVQIESIGFISFNGFAVAISSFVSQNFGAKKMDRVIDGYIHGRRVSLCIALFVCILFTAFSKSIVSIFLEPSTQSYFLAVDYIRIIAFAQFFAAIEAAANGFFMGIGNTKVISFISIFGNSLKVPLSILFVYLFNENGFWYAIFVSMFVRGFLSFIFALRERKSINEMLYSGSDLNIC